MRTQTIMHCRMHTGSHRHKAEDRLIHGQVQAHAHARTHAIVASPRGHVQDDINGATEAGKEGELREARGTERI